MQSKKWNNIILTLLAVLAMILVINKFVLSPNNSQTSDAEVTSEVASSLPSDFEQFYDKFHTDSMYQLSHITFPLSGIAVNDSSENESHTWSAETWTLHKPIDDIGSAFVKEYEILGSMVTEIFKARQYNFSMVRRFVKMDDEYQLIYYKEMGPG